MGDTEELDALLARIDAEIERRGPPKPRTAAYVGLHRANHEEIKTRGYSRMPLHHGQGAAIWKVGGWGSIAYIGIYDEEDVLLAEMPLDRRITLTSGDTLNVALDFGQLHVYNKVGMCIECGQRSPDYRPPAPRTKFPPDIDLRRI